MARHCAGWSLPIHYSLGWTSRCRWRVLDDTEGDDKEEPIKGASWMKWAAAAVLFSALLTSAAEPSSPRITLRLPSEVESQNVQIQYFLVGPFGGYGSSVEPKPDVDSYSIDMRYQGRLATEIKIVVFIAGCEFQTLDWQLRSGRTLEKTLACRPLPGVTVEGRVDGTLSDEPTLTVWYVASWVNEYFGNRDGMVQQFQIAKSLMNADGEFRIEIPDFRKDSLGSKGTLMFVWQSGNVGFVKEVKVAQTYPYIVLAKD
jgi:hypothetical protein